MSRIGMVVTTINDGSILFDYCTEAERTGWKNNVTFYVIPDKKSPRALYLRCDQIDATGFDVRFIDLDDQRDYLAHLDIEHLVPWNSDNRRNIGYLMAVAEECDTIISIDDDNYCRTNDFFNEHNVVTQGIHELDTIESKDKWVNVVRELLEIPAYHRGFPFRERNKIGSGFDWQPREGRVALNAGLWFESPDIDAVTWLGSSKSLLKGDTLRDSFVLGRDVWSPINSQNTAIRRDAMAAYYFVPMGATVQGLQIDRFADIFSGYFVEACVKHMGDYVRMGSPVANHIRNSHDYMKDLRQELACYEILDELTAWLTEEKLDGSTYPEAYLSLASRMEDAVERFQGGIWTVDTKGFFHRMAYCMRRWIKAFGEL